MNPKITLDCLEIIVNSTYDGICSGIINNTYIIANDLGMKVLI